MTPGFELSAYLEIRIAFPLIFTKWAESRNKASLLLPPASPGQGNPFSGSGSEIARRQQTTRGGTPLIGSRYLSASR